MNGAASGAFVASDYNGQLLVKSATQGASSTISYAMAPDTGTDVSDMLGLSEKAGAFIIDGYKHGTFLEEINKCIEAAGKMGVNVFGFVLDSGYRDTQDQKDFADWVNARSYRSVCSLVSNNPTAYSASDTTNIVDYCNKKAFPTHPHSTITTHRCIRMSHIWPNFWRSIIIWITKLLTESSKISVLKP